MEDFKTPEEVLRSLKELEEKLWERRMKLLWQYEKIERIKRNIKVMEDSIREHFGIDPSSEEALLLAHKEQSSLFEHLSAQYGEEKVPYLMELVERIRYVVDARRELKEIEVEVKMLDNEIDAMLEQIREYKRRFLS